MTNFLNEQINYLALLVHLNADLIVEVRRVRYSWLVRFKRGRVNFALFVKTTVIFTPIKVGINQIEQYFKQRTKLLITYNPVSKKFFVQESLTLTVLECLTISELTQTHLQVLIADCELQAQKIRKPGKPYFNPAILKAL